MLLDEQIASINRQLDFNPCDWNLRLVIADLYEDIDADLATYYRITSQLQIAAIPPTADDASWYFSGLMRCCPSQTYRIGLLRDSFNWAKPERLQTEMGLLRVFKKLKFDMKIIAAFAFDYSARPKIY